jgi:uncharacterized protein YbjT (DUF2867 family)
MRVLVAGATGVIGRQVVPLLASVGHDVIGLTRSESRAAALERTGAKVLVADGSFVRQVRAGKEPLVGGGTATFSFTHAHDAATAVVAALDKDTTGALNVVDDDPAPVSEWLPVLARILGAAQPGRAPAALARLAVCGRGVAFMTRLRGADNTRAKLHLDWRPRYASWRAGFASELSPDVAAARRPLEATNDDDGTQRPRTQRFRTQRFRTQRFEEHRPLLLGLAYRLLGSMWDAEDVVQDAYLRWIRTDRAEIREPRSFLVTVASEAGASRRSSPYSIPTS